MIALASFLVATAYVPFLWTGASQLKWVAVAVFTAALCRWHWGVAAFIAYCCWGAADYDALAKWIIVALAFTAGYRLPDIRQLLLGFGLGIGVSSVLVCLQAFGLDLFAFPAASGLFLNKNFLAEAACLIVIAAAAYKLWWVVLISTPALVLPLSRAALAAAFVGLIASFASWRWRVCLVLAMAVLVPFIPRNLDTLAERVAIWNEAMQQLTWFGHGIGAWSSASIDTTETRSYHMHNEWLQLVYELGIGSVLVFAVLIRSFGGFTIALIILASFGYPLHEPASAFISAAVLGHLCRRTVVEHDIDRGVDICDGLGPQQLFAYRGSEGLVPVGQAHPPRPRTLAHEHVSNTHWMV